MNAAAARMSVVKSERPSPLVNAPTLVVRGSTDPIATSRWVEEMVELLPSGRMAEIEGTGHAVNYSAPEEFVELIEEFICGVQEPSH